MYFERFPQSHPYCNIDVMPPMHSWEQRLCCTFGPKGHWNPICTYTFSEPWAVWWTAWPPTRQTEQDSTWVKLLLANHWLDETTYGWVGPPSPAPVPTHRGKSDSKPRPYKHDAWKLLRETPQVFTDSNGNQSTMSLVASQVCCDHAGGWLKAMDSTERVRACRKKHIMVYKRRSFAEEGEASIFDVKK